MMSDSNNNIDAEKEILKFKVDAAERLAAFDKLIQNGEFSNRLLQSTIKFFGIGSLGGLIALIVSAFALWPNLDKHIDTQIDAQMQKWNTRVDAQMKKWNELDVGFGYIRENRWADALVKLEEVYDLQVKDASTDKQYRSLLFRTLLWALASNSVLTVNQQAWKGEGTWKKLCGDGFFKVEITDRVPEDWDEAYCNQMLLCTLKFERERNVPKNVCAYLVAALNAAPIASSKADHSFQLAMECLVENKMDEAQTQLEGALEKDPQRYKDVSEVLKTFKRSPEFTMWSIYTKRLKEKLNPELKDFDIEFEELASRFALKAGS